MDIIKMIEEYKIKSGYSKGKSAYRGMVECPQCHKEFLLDTIDKDIALNPKPCFECFMTNEAAKRISK